MKDTREEIQDTAVGDAIRRLPIPDPRPTFFTDLRGDLERELHEGIVASARSLPRRRRYVRAIAVTAVVSAAVGGVVGASVSRAASGESDTTATEVLVSASTVGFMPAPGWNTIASNMAVGEETSPVAWAATIPFEPEDDYAGFPDNTVAELPSGGIVISVLGPRPFTGEAPFSQLSEEPLVVPEENCLTEAYADQPQPHIALCPLDRWVGNDQVLNVLVWFGTADPGDQPSQAQIDAANAELARFVIPD